MIQKTYLRTLNGLVVRTTFYLPASLWADRICLVGDFNGWHYDSHPMARDRDGRWQITVDLKPGRTYQFRYLRDGEWMNDNQADAYVYNPYGSHNFLVVTDPSFKQHLDP